MMVDSFYLVFSTFDGGNSSLSHLSYMQLSPGALLQLAEMGYSQLEATRALRFSGGDLGAAVDFLTEQRAKEKVGRGGGGLVPYSVMLCLDFEQRGKENVDAGGSLVRIPFSKESLVNA